MNGNRTLSILGTGYLVTALALTSAAPAPPQPEPHSRANAEWFPLNLTPLPTVVVYPTTSLGTSSSTDRPSAADLADLAEKPPAAVQNLRRADRR